MADIVPRPAVFFDRDGTLIEERCYLANPKEVCLISGAAAAVQRLRGAGFACVVVTNQSGVGRGLITEAQMHAVNAEMRRGSLARRVLTWTDSIFVRQLPLGTIKR